MSERSYKDDEVRAIVERALSAQPSDGIDHRDLLAIGAGVGLSPEAIERAVRDVQEAQLDSAAAARVASRRRRGVAVHAVVFSIVNAFLFAINFLTTPGQWWVLFPVFGWGLGLVLHAVFALAAPLSARRLQREKQRVLPKREVLQAASARQGERRGGVRIAEVLPEIEESSEPKAEPERERVPRGE